MEKTEINKVMWGLVGWILLMIFMSWVFYKIDPEPPCYCYDLADSYTEGCFNYCWYGDESL